MRIVCRETLVHRFDQLGIDFALADKCACRFLSFRKKGGAVLEAVLECLMRIVYDVAGRVVIRIVEAEGLRIKSTSSNSSRLHENEIHTEFLFMRI